MKKLWKKFISKNNRHITSLGSYDDTLRHDYGGGIYGSGPRRWLTTITFRTGTLEADLKFVNASETQILKVLAALEAICPDIPQKLIIANTQKKPAKKG